MLLLFPVPATLKLTNSPDKIFSYPCLSKWGFFTKQVLLYYFELLFTAICRRFSKQVFLNLQQIHRISEWNSLDINIRNSCSINAFKKELLKFIKPEPNSTYNINDTKGLKLLTRLWLRLSHSGDHKFRHNFQDCYFQCVIAFRILTQQLTSSFTASIIIVQGKSSFTR